MYQPEKLKERRVAQGLTQQELANALGVSKQAYSAWERGVKVPASDKVEQLEKLLSVPKGYFTEIEIVRLYHTLTPPNQEKAVRYVRALATEEQTPKVVPLKKKLVAYHVYEKMSAGIGATIYNDRDYDTVYYDEELAHDFASWVSGDSMEPRYHNGSVALIRETGFDYDGAVYAVVWNGQTFIKRVYRERDGLRLVSFNPDYADLFAPYEEEPRVVGMIVGNFMPLEG